jgi:hypothetical protein
MLFRSLTLTLFCIVLCFEHVKLWLCELSKLFCYICGEFIMKNINETLRASLESVLRLFWCEAGRSR